MSKVFNADELIEALEVPVLVIGGEEYKAKPLSFRDALVFQKRLQEMDTTNADALINFTEELCAVIEVPADKVLSLPPTVFGKVIEGFFGFLLGMTAE